MTGPFLRSATSSAWSRAGLFDFAQVNAVGDQLEFGSDSF